MSSKLTWDQRFSLIDAYSPTDAQATKVFAISQAELETARTMRAKGTIQPSKDFNVENYGNPFESVEETTDDSVAPTGETVTSIVKPSTKSKTSSSSVRKTTEVAPESATKRVSAPKKRGRKGTKISEAFLAIPFSPVSVDDFAKQYGVSIPVLRQSKRFDVTDAMNRGLGAVRVKVNKDSGVLEIWREKISG